MSLALGFLEKIAPRTLWGSESRDFTPWLAQNLSLLSAAIGLDLELIQMESLVGKFACDIEAIDTGTNRRVIIENQLEQTDHGHLGQLLTYAAGLDASVIIWISPDVREEHREAIDFLNRHTRETVDFFAVALEVVRIGDSMPAVVFRLAASPNAWAKTAAATTDGASASAKKRAYQEFYQGVMDELRTTHRFTNARAAQPQSWYSFSSGVTGFQYMAAFVGRNRLQAELYIDTGEAIENKRIFDFFLTQRAALESVLGEGLEWSRLDNKRACRIALVRQNTTIEDAERSGPEMHAWMVSRLLKLKETFGPHLKDAVRAAVEASVLSGGAEGPDALEVGIPLK
jgi:hypothetical protein